MIARIWHGWTTPENADVYENLLKAEIFPGIASKDVPGYRGIQLYRRCGNFKQNKRASPCYWKECPFLLRNKNLNHSDICSGRAFLPLLDVESHAVAFIERFKTA